MSTILDEYRKRLQMYYDAEAAILAGSQSYSLGSRSLTRANLAEVQNMIKYLLNQIAIEEAKERGKGKMRVMGGIPRDI